MLINALIILENKANSGHFKLNMHEMPKTILKIAEPLRNLTMFLNSAQKAFVKLGMRIVVVFLSSSYRLFKTASASVGCRALYLLKKIYTDVNFLYFYQNNRVVN